MARIHFHPLYPTQAQVPHRPNSKCSMCVLSAQCPVGQLLGPWADAVRKAVTFNSFRPGQVLLGQGEVSDRFRFIKTGLVLLRQSGAGGVAGPVALVGRGYMVGLMGASGAPSLTQVEAAGPVSVCEFSYGVFRQDGGLSEQGARVEHELKVRTLQTLLDWGRLMRMRGVLLRMAATLGLLVQEQGEHRVRLPSQRVLAELLAVSRESVGRALEDLAGKGLLVRVGRGVVDVDVPALQAWLSAPSSPAAP